ncbi:uncharacterized protein LOC135170203 isoform X2 [Diachasmimorpha longicaudata]|uniref:uncharacterized protein LOC135170203 isoform X2 n=1 Tax=Diachasmimorpha longicaudata TaxID=58733 RepID=UPI0030B8DFC9
MNSCEEPESPVCDTLDLSGQGLKKLSRCPSDADINTLIVDDNELQRLDNLDSYHRITKLSIVRNQLLRMYGVSKLHNLVTLNLANNGILTIEGIKDMPNLTTLCLAGNNVKSIEHLHTNMKLEHLDLSENSISHVSDISYLRNLKELFLHNNRIITLRQCERYLPTSLETLTLANNNITDLNEMSHLGSLTSLINFSIANNPCVSATGNSIGFDYRPFVINWCMSLKSIDGYPVDPIESLKAEWLYSQGRGRQFRVGEHSQLAQYLASVCPLSGECLENETDRKLRLILSKAQHHQQQLSQQGDTVNVHGMSASPATRRRLGGNRTSSPRRPIFPLWSFHEDKYTRKLNEKKYCSCPSPSKASIHLGVTRNSMRMRSPDRMVTSCHTDAMISSCHGQLEGHESLMTQSLDPNMLCNTFNSKLRESGLQDVEETSSPLQAATKLVPVPESLMSPDFRPPSGLSRILPKTPPSRLSSPIQTTIPGKASDPSKAHPIITASTSPSKFTNLTHKSTPSNPPKSNIAKPIHPPANGKCPQSVKINNYVQSKTMTPRRSLKNSPNLPRAKPKPQNDKTLKQQANGSKKPKDDDNIPSSDEDSEFCQAKLDGIRHRAIQRRQEDTNKSEDQTEKAAVLIQRIWRGYHTRNLNKKATNVLKTIEMMRTNKYIQKLSSDMEATRTALESEHKLQLLQMQAINALWKKVVSLQPGRDEDPNADVVTNLAQTCNLLHTQVQQLQDSMSEIKRCMSHMQPRAGVDQGVGTQTEISAVHTPAGEENTFPYGRTVHRPQSLSIHQTIHEGAESKSFASNLVDSVLKKVSQSTDTTDDEVNTDILNSSNPELVELDRGRDGEGQGEMFKSCEEIEGFREDGVEDFEDVVESEEVLCKELQGMIEKEGEGDCDIGSGRE